MSTRLVKPLRTVALTRLVATLAAVAAVGAAFAPAPADAAPPSTRTTTVGNGPERPSIASALAWGLANNLRAAPPGANDWSCRPSPAHPRPVVLVQGTWANAYNNWAKLSPALKRQGYCVFALSYGGQDRSSVIGKFPGVNGLGNDTESGRQLARFVDLVLERTGSSQVDLVGHSQGVTVSRQYMRFNGGTDASDPSTNKVASLVSLAGPMEGSDLWGIDDAFVKLNEMGVDATAMFSAVYGRSTADNGASSPFIAALNQGGQTERGVRYTTVSTRYDALVTPYQHSYLTDPGPDATVTRYTLQNGCADNHVGHANITYDDRAIHLVRQALDPDTDLGPAPCVFVPPST